MSITLAKAYKEGYRRVCIACKTVFEAAPTSWYEDGHGGHPLEICRCGCDLIGFIVMKGDEAEILSPAEYEKFLREGGKNVT